MSIVASIVLAAAGAASSIAPLSVESLFDAETLGVPVDLSPDGEWVAVSVSAPDRNTRPEEIEDEPVREEQGSVSRSQLRLINTRTGRTISLGSRGVESSGPSWSPDGSLLAFQSGVDDKARLWVWSRNTQQARLVSPAIIRDSTAFGWTPDGTQIVTVVLPEGMTTAEINTLSGETRTNGAFPLDTATPGAQVAVYRAGIRNRPDAATDLSRESARASSHRSIPPWNHWYWGDLAVIDVATGAYRRITTGYKLVKFRVSPDGRRSSFTTAKGQEEGRGYRNLFDVMVVDIQGGEPRVIAEDVMQGGNSMDASWSPLSDALGYCDSPLDRPWNCYVARLDARSPATVEVQADAGERRLNNRLYRTPLWEASGERFYTLGDRGLWCVTVSDHPVARRVSVDTDKRIVEIVAPSGGGRFTSPDAGRSLIAMTRDEATKQEGFYAVNLRSGAMKKLMEEPRRHGRTPFWKTDASADGRVIAYARESADAPEQLWVSDSAFRWPHQVTQLNPHLANIRFGRSRLLEWRDAEGVVLRGALLLPSDYVPGKRYPLVVSLYGDRALSDEVNSFGIDKHAATTPQDNKQLLATRGYAVLRADTRTREGTVMRDIAGSVLPAVDKLIELGIADPERLGLIGHSFGGYSALSVIVQTDRFEAAVVSAGQSSLLGVYSEMSAAGTNWKISWAEQSQGKMRGTPWEHRERYIENSPFFYFDRITAPVLILQGTDDTAIAQHLGDEIFLSLRRLGKQVEYAKYIGEGHVIAQRANTIDYAQRIIAWLDENLDVARDANGRPMFDGDSVRSRKALPKPPHPY